ncbi:MAG: ribosomal protein S18-alanine N-acetyltransferase [Thermoplasmatales archaeon]|nr:ribosomal protein S18-alanine N-acetyltransferase [Thermoplasmatales archaeon]
MIRTATIQDLDEICRIEKLCFKKERYSEEFILYLLENQNNYSAVFEENKKIAGYIIASFHKNTARIISLAVHPAHRKKGIGEKLLNSAEEKAKKLKMKNITLEVAKENMDAVNFYLSKRYKIDGLIKDYYGIGKGAYRMSKNL